MPKHAGPTLRKVTLNLYDADAAMMQQRYGFGWSEKVRDLVHEHVLYQSARKFEAPSDSGEFD